MSLLDDASLVVVPSGYKSGTVYSVKPTNGDGDLDFTRSNDTATRVNSAGLIEKVRTNLQTYSENFDNASWTKEALSVTANNIESPDGTQNADLLTANGLSARKIIYSNVSTIGGQSYSLSIYAKKGTNNFVQVAGASTTFGNNVFANFNLDTGVVGSVGSLTTASIQNVGNGWYRCTIIGTAIATISAFGLILAIVESSTSTRLEINTLSTTIYLWGAQVEVSDFGATDYIPTTSAAVSVGMTANVPRLDYSGGGCPKLLLEPQRTNLVTYSEQFDNAAYITDGTGSVTANNTTSPDGTQNADLYTSSKNGISYIYQNFTVTNGATYTTTVFAKAGTTNFLLLDTINNTRGVIFNLLNGTIASTINGTGTITSVGNGWYRCSVTSTATSTAGIFLFMPPTSGSSATSAIGNSVYAWGAQVEAGSYATSYIPTLAAAVTRGADACSKTGISSLIGQTEGTLYYDGFFGNEATEVYLFLQNGASSGVSNSIYLQRATNTIAFNVTTATLQSFIGGGSFTIGQRVKIAAAYKANDFVLYVNGVQIGTDNTGSVPTCDTLQFASYRGLPTNAQYINVKGSNQALLFPTRLTNTQLAELTTL